MTVTPLTRRRFIAISASAIAPLLGGAAGRGHRTAIWRGIALGASASIRIEGRTRDEVAGLLRACVQEIARLEAIFSLYRRDSELSRLNRDGGLDQPSADLLALLTTTRGVHEVTGGAFDPTIQPLWDLYARHFRNGPADRAAGPPPDRLEQMLLRVGLNNVAVSPAAVRFKHRGMAMTLNGIAQGYITDRVSDVLRSHGLSKVLVNVGEIRALGGRMDGQPWKIGIPAEAGARELGTKIDLVDRAIATSATSGTVFDDQGRFGHIIDPRSGYPALERRQVSVIAPTAALADAYSTAFCLLPQNACRAIAEASGFRVIML